MFTIGVHVFDKDGLAAAIKLFSDRVRKYDNYNKVAKRSRAALMDGLWNALEGFKITMDEYDTHDSVVESMLSNSLSVFFAAIDGDKNQWLVQLLNIGASLLLKEALISFLLARELDFIDGEEN
jgi:hypothetical protein